MEQLDRIVREETKHVKSMVHDYGHLNRVASGAKWIVNILGGTKEEEELAYATGLLHDIVRPATEKICHAEASGERSREILLDLCIDKQTTERIVETIKSHRKPHEWKSPLHQSVYHADKILEEMGYFIVFRLCYYIGECTDYAGKDPIESIIKQLNCRIERFIKKPFEPFFFPLADYQLQKRIDFKNLLVEDVAWAKELALEMYRHGEKQKISVEEAIKRFEPKTREAEKTKKEALLYMNGKLFPKLEKILKV